MKIGYCQKCHIKRNVGSYDKFCQQMVKINKEFEIENNCQSTCGLSIKQYVVATEDELIVNQNEEDIFEKLKEKYGN